MSQPPFCRVLKGSIGFETIDPDQNWWANRLHGYPRRLQPGPWPIEVARALCQDKPRIGADLACGPAKGCARRIDLAQ
jgi:hypothetical protein